MFHCCYMSTNKHISSPFYNGNLVYFNILYNWVSGSLNASLLFLSFNDKFKSERKENLWFNS